MNFNDLNTMQVLEGYKKFSGMSEDELLKTLVEKVDELKSEGKFDVSALEKMYELSSSGLNDEQKKRMRTIIDLLKG